MCLCVYVRRVEELEALPLSLHPSPPSLSPARRPARPHAHTLSDRLSEEAMEALRSCRQREVDKDRQLRVLSQLVEEVCVWRPSTNNSKY